MSGANLTDDEVKETLRSLKHNKSPGYDNISLNVISETSDIFFNPFKYILNLLLQQIIFLKTQKLRRCSQFIRKRKSFY